jgi:hypothetical protein
MLLQTNYVIGVPGFCSNIEDQKRAGYVSMTLYPVVHII